MAKTNKPAKSRGAYPKVPASSSPADRPVQSHALRETVESLVIAFVLAFLFRTFEAEAFVIPTGSMAPTLMGRHKDVNCPKCDYRFQVSASEEDSDTINRPRANTIAGMCPMCRYVLPMRPDLVQDAPGRRGDAVLQGSYNGDRILVNKYIYAFTDPERWDVVVFKFPGDAKINYIKRLVGLPGETLRIYQGDLFVGAEGATGDTDFEIAHKPADTMLAMRQAVHDTNYDPAELEAAGWPLRWQSNEWQVEKTIEGKTVRQRYHVEGAGGDPAWLRYQHIVPHFEVWRILDDSGGPLADGSALAEELKRFQVPKLITDANPYNAREDSLTAAGHGNLAIGPQRQGIHWVGDLILEANIEIEAAQGELMLDLVEGGRHFTCTVDLTNGDATLSAEGAGDFAPQAKTPLRGTGKHRVAFANVDDRLLLWVDGDLISFDSDTAYDVEQVFGERSNILPRSSEEDPGDLAPAGIGSRGAQLAVTRLRLWRDIYYIADRWNSTRQRIDNVISDYDVPRDVSAMLYDPARWDVFGTRRAEDFPLGEDQFFVMGDNSAESSDARLWYADSGRGGRPGGDYLERRLLIGKALCVYWPHSWHRIPGTPIPFPLFPNFSDMRLVR
jgi:signal peptidase I